MKRDTPQLLIVGAPALSDTAAQTLRDSGLFADANILMRADLHDAIALMKGSGDIGLALLLCDEAATRQLPEALAALIGADGDAQAMRPVMVRCRPELTRAERDALWRLGTADRLFSQSVASPDLADSVAAAMRDQGRLDTLATVTGAASRLERARTLWELGELILQMVNELDIGGPGGIFCIRGGSSEPRLMAVAGSGRFSGIGCMPFDDIADSRVVAAVHQAMTTRQTGFNDESCVVHIATPEGDIACLYLALDAPLSPWQRRLVGVLTQAFSIAIAKNQAANRLLRTQHATISTMATLAEYRDVDTGEHVARVARSVTEIAQVLANRGYVTDPDLVGQIGLAAILHDIGKIAIPEGILLKPGPLSLAERQAMEMHTLLGRDILERAATRSDNAVILSRAAEIAHCHHEKYDGSGYPAGLKGDAIPLGARIVALVDVFDALTSLRPYKQPWAYDKAIGTIVDGTGSHFDPMVVDAFLSLEGRRRSAGFFVWNDAMSVGHPDIDADHKRLVSIINRLWVAEDNGNRQVIEFVLEDLVHYTEVHFKREEQMLADMEYDEFEHHRGIHQAICRRLEEIRWEYFQGIREELRGEILEFLKDWLNQHILVEDMRYRPYLRKRTPDSNLSALSHIDPEPVK